MSIGKEILPNVYIDNINLYDELVSFTVFVLDSLDEPRWSNKERFKDLMELKVFVSEDTERSVEILTGANKIDAHDTNTERYLLFHQRTSNTRSIGNIDRPIAYHKHMSVQISKNVNHLTIFANVSIESLNIDGPISAERIIQDSLIVTETNIMFKGDEQYYGPAHLHMGNYMEGSRHSDRAHSPLTISRAPNLKLKDYRNKIYKIPDITKEKQIPIFSDLFSYFEDDTTYRHMFFFDAKEALITRTKYGKYLRNCHPSIMKNLLYDFKFRTFYINRMKVEMYHQDILGTKNTRPSKIIETKNLSIASSRTTSMETLRGQKVQFLSHRFEESLYGIHFEDDLNHNAAGIYQYEVSFSFKDPTISLIQTIIVDLKVLLEQAKEYRNSAVRRINVNDILNRPNDLFINNLTEVHVVLSEQIVSYRSVLYDMSVRQQEEDLIRMYNMLNPKTCTEESLSLIVQEIEKLYQTYVLTFDTRSDIIKSNRESRSAPKTHFSLDRVQVVHRFNQTVAPSGERLFYKYHQVEPTINFITDGARVTNSNNVSSTPKTIGRGKNHVPFGSRNPQSTFFLGNLAQETNQALAGFAISVVADEMDEEKFINSSEYLGDETKFEDFSVDEKCEIKKHQQTSKVEAAIILGNSDFEIEALQTSLNRLEVFSGFEKFSDGRNNLTRVIWSSGVKPTGVVIVKQTPASYKGEGFQISYSKKKYMVLRNSGKHYLSTDNYIEQTILRSDYYQLINYNYLYTTNSIVNHSEEPGLIMLPMSNREYMNQTQGVRSQPVQQEQVINRTTEGPVSTTEAPVAVMTTSLPTGGGY